MWPSHDDSTITLICTNRRADPSAWGYQSILWYNTGGYCIIEGTILFLLLNSHMPIAKLNSTYTNIKKLSTHLPQFCCYILISFTNNIFNNYRLLYWIHLNLIPRHLTHKGYCCKSRTKAYVNWDNIAQAFAVRRWDHLESCFRYRRRISSRVSASSLFAPWPCCKLIEIFLMLNIRPSRVHFEKYSDHMYSWSHDTGL